MNHINLFNRIQQEKEKFNIKYTDFKKLTKNCNCRDTEDTNGSGYIWQRNSNIHCY